MGKTREIITLGLDPSLTHGSLVEATWEISGDQRLYKSHRVLYEWGNKKKSVPDGVRREASPLEIFVLARRIVRGIPPPRDYNYLVPVVAVDWDSSSVMWRGQAHTVAKLTLLVGYLVGNLHAHGYLAILITPAEVRAAVGLVPAAKKREVWDRVGFINELKLNSDGKDSLILANIVAQTIGDEGDHVREA